MAPMKRIAGRAVKSAALAGAASGLGRIQKAAKAAGRGAVMGGLKKKLPSVKKAAPRRRYA